MVTDKVSGHVMPTVSHETEPEVVGNEAPIDTPLHIHHNGDYEEVGPDQGHDQAMGEKEGSSIRLDNQAPSTITRSGRIVRPPSR
jgi:hypothetical protein